jgi:hypothetical protein
MNRTEHLLICATEECAELQQAISKALRFGLDDGSPDRQTTNAEDIMKEYTDLISVMMMLLEAGAVKDFNMDRAIEAKREKVIKYMSYAKERGTLV